LGIWLSITIQTILLQSRQWSSACLRSFFGNLKVSQKCLTIFYIFRHLTIIPEDTGIQIKRCIPLTADRYIMLYQKEYEVHISISSINLDNNSCKLIGKTYRIPNCQVAIRVIMSVISVDTICTEVYSEERALLYQLKIDYSALSFELQAVFSVPISTAFYRIIGEQCLFAIRSSISAWIDCIAISDMNGSLTKLEGTGIQLDYNAFKIGGVGVSFTFYYNNDSNLVSVLNER
jgi:hypothetical protein